MGAGGRCGVDAADDHGAAAVGGGGEGGSCQPPAQTAGERSKALCLSNKVLLTSTPWKFPMSLISL